MRLFNIYLLLQYWDMHGSSHAYWCIDTISVEIMYLYLFISNKATLQLQIPVCLSICQIFWCRFLSSMIIYSLPFCPLVFSVKHMIYYRCLILFLYISLIYEHFFYIFFVCFLSSYFRYIYTRPLAA